MNPKYHVVLSKRYTKSLKRLTSNKDFNRSTLEDVIGVLARGETLDPKHQDHQLKGELKDYRECHVQNDMLLMYQKYDKVLILLLVDLGSHSDLF